MKTTIVSACVLVLSFFHGAMAAPALGALQSFRARARWSLTRHVQRCASFPAAVASARTRMWSRRVPKRALALVPSSQCIECNAHLLACYLRADSCRSQLLASRHMSVIMALAGVAICQVAELDSGFFSLLVLSSMSLGV
jgi:hypothetical protein